MKLTTSIIAASIGALFSVAASAQSLESIEQRDLMQQQRIYQGLQSGQLTAREAAQLQSETDRIDRMQARSLQDGRLSESERDRITQAQNRVGREIYAESHDRQFANPNSRSSQYMQDSVRREIREDRRIADGVASGRLDHRDVARAEYRNLEGRGGYDGQRFQYGNDHRGRDDNRFGRHDRFDGGRTHGASVGGLRNGQHGSQSGGWNPSANHGAPNEQHRGWTSGASHASPTGLSNGQHNGWNRGTTASAGSSTTTPASGQHNGWSQDSARGSYAGSRGGSTAVSTTGVTTGPNAMQAGASTGRGNYAARASREDSPRVVASASMGGQRGGGARNR